MNKLSSIKVAIFINVLLSGLIFTPQSLSIEPKEVENVDLNTLIKETQVSNSGNGMTLVWWIPREFWSVALSRDTSMPATEREQFLSILEPYFMLGVVQGEMSPLGVTQFYDIERVRQNLSLSYENGDGEQTVLTPATEISSEVQMLQNMIKPMLEQMMGNMGQNFHFLTYEDLNSSGKRQVSPYEDGTIQIGLAGNSNIADSDFAIALPLNSLYVPRICPNGKEAHISWEYCPWDGTKLED